MMATIADDILKAAESCLNDPNFMDDPLTVIASALHLEREHWSGKLRDQFAGQALAGMLAGICSDHDQGSKNAPRAFDRIAFKDAASDAYHLADAMLAARKSTD